MTKPPAIIFDLDGTLADTLGDLTSSLNVLLAEIGKPGRSRTEVEGMVGDGLGPLISRVAAIDNPKEIRDLVQRYRPLYRERMLDTTCLYPGIDAMLDDLTELDTQMCVFSNKPQEFTTPICETLLVRRTFVRWLGAGETVPRKPNPTGALELASAMDTRPSQVVFVGDSSIDVETAANAGMTSVGVTWGFRTREHLIAAGADYIIDEPAQLLPLIFPCS